MNASAAPVSKSSQQRANEPSMEEILASIRRIIADDRILPLSPRPLEPLAKTEGSRGPEPEAEAARALAEDSRSGAPRLGGQRRNDAGPEIEREPSADLRPLRLLSGRMDSPDRTAKSADDAEKFFAELASEAVVIPQDSAPSAPDPAPSRAPGGRPQADPDPLLSVDADASVASSFQSLASTVFLQNSEFVEHSIRDLLRPLLKQWLDEHLPIIVERLVRAEIERVARGARR